MRNLFERLLVKFVYVAMAGAVFAAAVGCTKSGTTPDEPLFPYEGEYTPSTIPVGFTALADWAEITKAEGGGSTDPHAVNAATDPTITQFYELDTIALFGYYLQNGALVNGAKVEQTSPNFMYNQPVICDKVTYDLNGTVTGTSWHYSPVKYWPNNEDDRISFYSFFPYPPYYNRYIETDLEVSPNTQLGAPQITYTLPTSLSAGRVDFLYAQALKQSKPSAGQATQLEFRHLMGKIQFFIRVLPPDGSSISENDGNYSAYIKSISYDVNTKGTFKYSTDSDGYPLWELDALSAKREFTLPYGGFSDGIQFSKGSSSDETVGNYGHDFTALLLPVTISELNINYSTDGVNFNNNTITGQNINIVAGKVTTIHLTIKPGDVQPLTLTAVTKPWKDVVMEPGFSVGK